MTQVGDDIVRPAGSLSGGAGRLALVLGVLVVLFAALGVRLIALGLRHDGEQQVQAEAGTQQARARAELTDRNGNILAIDVPTSSLFADPAQLIGIDETAEKLAATLPGLDAAALRNDLAADKRFVWIRRYLTPDQRRSVFDLGLPGLDFLQEPKRFYPLGALAAHVTGYVDNDNKGLAGIERALDVAADKAAGGRAAAPAGHQAGDVVALSLDIRVQHALDVELKAAIERYKAKAAAGVVLDLDSGEILALVSLPSFDPLNRAEALQPDRLDRVRRGVYELGSVLKCFTVAMGLDEGAVTLEERIDVATPLRIGTFAIKERHAPESGTLSVAEIFTKSSNVGAARIARKVGADRHRAFLSRLGLLGKLDTEIGGAGLPLQPATWRVADSLSVAYGYRLSVSPLQLAAAAMPLFNGGYLRPVTLLRRPDGMQPQSGVPVLKSETSALMQKLMRANVQQGTGRLADAPAYRIGGKTGTARLIGAGGYGDQLRTSFLGIFPAESPRYLTMVMLEAPQSASSSADQRDAAFNVAPVTRRVVERIAPFLGVKPQIPADN